MINLKNFLTNRYYNKFGDIRICIGVDPSINSTGWAIVASFDKPPSPDHSFVVTEAGLINPVGLNHGQKLRYLTEELDGVIKTLNRELLRHNSRPVQYTSRAYTLGVGLEVTAFFGGGRERLSRDLLQRDAIAACRIALAQNDLEVVGDEPGEDGKEHPIRPISLQSFTGSIKLKGDEIKEQNKKWVMANVDFVCSEEGLNYDQYDAIALGCLAFDHY